MLILKDLHELPKVKDSLSYIYIEHAKIKQDGHSIAIFDKKGMTPVPCATLNIIMLGPGTSITHAAIKNLVDNDCLILWCGEEGVRLYAEGLGRTRSSRNVIRQALLSSIPYYRLLIAKNLYIRRFNDTNLFDLTIRQLRGKEGARVRKIYYDNSERTGIEWKGRSYKRDSWQKTDPINRALSAANSCLYGMCHAAIVAMGYSPALGFIHIGKQLSFVYDIADLYKSEMTIPLAFDIVKKSTKDISRRVRKACRDVFHENKLLKLCVRDIKSVLNIEENLNSSQRKVLENTKLERRDYNNDGALPGFLWDPKDGFHIGGKNFDDSPE